MLIYIIQNCYFEGNSIAIDNTGGANISNCTFDSNDLAVRLGDGSSLTNNIITNNGVGVAVLAYSPNSTLIENNTICYNTDYNLQNLTDKNFQVNANCFCTSDSTIIENYLFDGYDDITRGLVNYAIYDDSCETIIDYVVKVNIDGTNFLTELYNQSFEVLKQTQESILVYSANQHELQLVNLIGAILHQQKMEAGSFDFSLPTHSPGVYLLRSSNGNSVRIYLSE